jgi:hypothetical protein
MAMNSYACLSGVSLASTHLTGYISYRIRISLGVYPTGVHLMSVYLVDVHLTGFISHWRVSYERVPHGRAPHWVYTS